MVPPSPTLSTSYSAGQVRVEGEAQLASAGHLRHQPLLLSFSLVGHANPHLCHFPISLAPQPRRSVTPPQAYSSSTPPVLLAYRPNAGAALKHTAFCCGPVYYSTRPGMISAVDPTTVTHHTRSCALLTPLPILHHEPHHYVAGAEECSVPDLAASDVGGSLRRWTLRCPPPTDV